MIGRKLAISSLLILGLSAGEKTDNCPAPWSSKWGKKFKKSFRDFFKYPNHKDGNDACIPELRSTKCIHRRDGYEDKFTGVCGMLLKDHDSYHGSLKTTGKMTNCVLSFNVQGSVLKPEKLKLASRMGFENFCTVSIWNEWGSWGECKGQCGRGYRQRQRRCDGMITDKYENKFSRTDKAASILPLFSSGSCPGTNIQFRKCQLRPCSSKDSIVSRPIRGLRYGMEGVWSEWTEWSFCSKSCGTGLKVRKRKCLEGACRGLSEMPKKCKKKICPVFNPSTTIMKFVHEKDKPCGALKSCGHGLCIESQDGTQFCNCAQNSSRDASGVCVKSKKPILPAEYPTSFAECDKWEFFVNGKAISIQQCYEMVKRRH